MSVVLFFSIWVTLLALTHWYVGRRITRAAQWTGSRRVAAWSVVGTLFLVPQIAFFLLVNGRESHVTDALSWAGYIGLGFFSLLLTGVFLRDIILLAGRLGVAIARRRDDAAVPAAAPVDPGRRRALVHSTNLLILGVSAGLSGYGLYESRRRATLEHVEVPLKHLPPEFDGYHIALFTDVHVGPTVKRGFVETIVEQVNELDADLIAFTGDMVDGSVPWLRDDVAPLRALSSRDGVLFVTGNHEYYSGVGPWVREVERLGMHPLMNEHRLLRRGDAQLVLCGVTDYGARDFTPDQPSDPTHALNGAPEDTIRILLAHQPRSIHAATRAGFHLQLSGHTHGGQFFPWNHLATLNQPYIKGLHKHNDTWIYVNRGTGYWGPPLRVGIPPEVTLIRLLKA